MKSDKTYKPKKPVGKSNATSLFSKTVKQKNINLFSFKSSNLLIIAGIVIIAFLAYSNALHNSILNFDDNEYFFNYPEVTHLSWNSIVKYFSNYYVIMYQPLPILTFALNFNFTQLDTFPLHFLNLIFHLSNVLLVYVLIIKLSQKPLVAIIASALFALHPMNVEAVSWISARSSSMYTFFYILSIIFYVNFIKTKNRAGFNYLLSFAFFILSLFSKAQAVTLPLVLLLIDLYFQRLNFSKAANYGKGVILEKVPFFILSVIFGYITISDKGTINNITNGMLISYTYFEAVLMACYSFIFYIYKFIYPVTLCAIHVYPPRINGHLPMVYYLSPLILVILIIGFYLLARSKRYVFFGIVLFVITISINIQLIPSRLFIVSERYGYFPYVGLSFIIGQFISDLSISNFVKKQRLKPILLFIFAFLICILAYLTYQRNFVWKDNINFMTDIINKNPAVPYLSRAYGTRANAYEGESNLDAALSDFSKAIELKPDDELSYYNRGLLNIKLNKFKDAISDFDNSIRLKPGIGIMYSNRAVAEYHIGDFSSSLDDCNKAIELNKSIVETYNTRGALRYMKKDYKGSEDDFNTAIKLQPGNSESYKNRGNLYLGINQMDKACKDFKTAADMGNSAAENLVRQYCHN